jgi:carbamoyl-phosphate synthase large subunit
MIKIGITGTGSLIGQAIIKSIRDSKYSNEVVLTGFDYFENTVGSYWCSNNYVLPDIYKSPNLETEWLEKITEICIKHKIEYLFVGVDFELPLFAKNKVEIEKKCNLRLLVSDVQVIEIGNDKYKTYEFLKRNNFFYPKTDWFENIDKSTLEYPVILKPAVGARSRDVYKINNEMELDTFGPKVPGAVVQELIGDENTEYTCGVVMIDGNLLGSIALNRRLSMGNTSEAVYRADFPKIIYEYIEKIALSLNPLGSCNFQLRLGKDGIPKLFEINPRHSGTTYMRSKFGFNEIEMILDYFIEGKVISPVLKEGKVIRYFDEMFQNF